jgi:hypothetical protein
MIAIVAYLVMITSTRTWAMLTVDFDTPSYKFTVNIHTYLISKLIVLTPLVWQVRTRMWFLEYVGYTGFKCLKEYFRVKFIKHFMRRSWSPSQVKTWSEHGSK